MQEIGVRIKELRQEKNISIKMMALDFNTTARTIQRWEKGERTPEVDSIIQLAKYFDVSTDYLLGLKPD